MAKPPRLDIKDQVYHAFNRANNGLVLFEKDQDYLAFENVMQEALDRYPVRLFAYELMPNHWHFSLSPTEDGGMGKFMQWLSLTHTQRWHAHHKTAGRGHLYQDRYKSFAVQEDEHFLWMSRYIERNALRAKLVRRAEDWRWGSLWVRANGSSKQKKMLSSWPIKPPRDYLKWVNQAVTDEELAKIRTSVKRGRPYGDQDWINRMVKNYHLEATVRDPHRPKN